MYIQGVSSTMHIQGVSSTMHIQGVSSTMHIQGVSSTMTDMSRFLLGLEGIFTGVPPRSLYDLAPALLDGSSTVSVSWTYPMLK
jgi:hypothetical protein